MTDPAAEAAKRVCPAGDSPTSLAVNRVAESGAREALKPIQELVEKAEALGDELVDIDDLKRLIYSSEELER